MTPVTIVCGPPGAGKSSYVEQRLRWGDLVVSVDKLWAAISGQPEHDKPDGLLPYVMALRESLYGTIASGKGKAGHAWIIAGLPRADARDRLRTRFQTDDVVVLETPHVSCLRNIRNDPLRAERWEYWQELVGKWWLEYERDERDKTN